VKRGFGLAGQRRLLLLRLRPTRGANIKQTTQIKAMVWSSAGRVMMASPSGASARVISIGFLSHRNGTVRGFDHRLS